jgi:hypothetical protein
LWSVAVGLRPAEFHEKAPGRRLKAGGSQDWLPHFFDPVGLLCFAKT